MYAQLFILFGEAYFLQNSILNHCLQGVIELPATSPPGVETIEITLTPTNPAEDVTVESITIHVCGEVASTTALPSGATSGEGLEISKFYCANE